MKKYKNFNKYFNTNPRFLIKVLGIIKVIFVILFVGVAIFAVTKDKGDSPSDKKPIYMICIAGSALCLGVSTFSTTKKRYQDQEMLVNARIGKELQMRGYDVEQSLAEIEAELSTPMLAQIHTGINRSFNFCITKNWIIGADDLIAMRANAVRNSDVVSVDLDEITISHLNTGPTNSVTKKHYARVKVTDKDNRTYCFNVLNEECQREAYNYITQNVVGYTNDDVF